MTRALNILFRESPYWGWMIAGVLLCGLLLVWLLGESLGPKSPRGSRLVVRVRSTVFTAFVVLDLALLILLATLFRARVDVTRDKLYSLSDASRELVADLDDTMTVEVFFPEEVPAELVPFRETLVELLDEYRDAAGGQLVVKYLDPRDPGVVERADNLGIRPQPFATVEADKPKMVDVMRGVAMTYRGRTERIPVVEREVGLEYLMTSLIKTLTGEPVKIGLLIGHREVGDRLSNPDFIDTIEKALAYHDVVTVNLEGGAKPVPDDVQALFMTTPLDPPAEAELYQIDQFLMRGGALAFMGNGFAIIEPPPQMRMMMQQPQLPEIKPLDEGLAKFLRHYGLDVGDDVLLDDDPDDNVQRRITGVKLTRGGAFEREFSLLTHIFWTKDIEATHPAAAGLSNMLVFGASSVDLSEEVRKRADVRLATLIRSPERSWLGSSSEAMFPVLLGGMPPQEPPKRREGAAEDELARATRGSRPLLVVVEGPMTSYFDGKEVPAPAEAGENRLAKSVGNVRILGFGSHIPLEPDFLKAGLEGNPRVSDVPKLMQNTVDWLLADKGLLEVRSKSAEPPQFASAPDPGHQLKMKLGLTFGLPFVFVAAGVGVLLFVRYSRRNPAKRSEGGGAGGGKDEGEVKP